MITPELHQHMCHQLRALTSQRRWWRSVVCILVLAFAVVPSVLRAANPLLDTQPPLTHDNAPIGGSVTVDIGTPSVDIDSTAIGTWEYRLVGSGTWTTFSPTISFPAPISEGQTLVYEIKFTAPDGSWWFGDFIVRTGSGDGTARYDDLWTDKGVTPENTGCCASGHGSTCKSGCGGTTGDGSATVNDGAQSDPGSLLEMFELPVDPNEPDFDEGGLLLYRTRLGTSDNAGDIGTLRYVSLPTMKVLVENDDPAEANLVYTCSIRQASGFAVEFQISAGETFGRPAGAYIQSGARIELLNGINGAVVTNPAIATHIRQYRQNGGVLVFDRSTGAPVKYTTRTGRVTSNPATKVELYESGGHLAQIKTAAGLLVIDEITTRKYTVKRYLPDQISGGSAPYSVSGDPVLMITVEHPANTATVEVTRVLDGRTTVNIWNYSLGASLNEWTLTRKVNNGQGLETAWIKSRRNDTLRGLPSIRRIWDTPGNTSFYSGWMYVNDQAWGVRAGTSSGATDGSRAVTYFTNPANPGAYGKISGKTDSHGSHEQYEYDSTGRMTSRKSEWLDTAASKHEVFSYVPHVGGESLKINDYRPRTTEIKVDGGNKTISKIMFAAYTDGTTDEYTEITKRGATPSSGWSDAANLVTVRTYYSNSASPDVRRGRLRQIVAPDGEVTTYDYTSNGTHSSALTTTVAHNVTGSAPISGRSTRTVTVVDALGRVREVARAVCVASPDWIAYEKTHHDYSDGTNGPRNYRFRTRLQDLVGSNQRTVATYDWSGGRLISQTDEAGTLTSYEFDLYERRFKVTRGSVASSGSAAAQQEITTTISSTTPIRLGAGIGFRDEQTETTAGGLKLTSSVARDDRSRVTSRTDENGYTTQYVYQLNGRQVTVTRPDNSTEITLRHKDGNIKSVTGTGVVASHTAYAVDGATGRLTTTRRAATHDNVRYTATVTNMLGQTMESTRPARNGGTTTTTTQSYHYETGTGHLMRSSSTAANVPHQLHWRNAEGTITRSVISTGTTINLASDRVTESESSFESSGGELWQTTTNFVYSIGSSRKAVSTRKTLLGGFVVNEIARSRSTNELSAQTTITSQTLAAGLLTSTTNHPETTADSVNISYHGRPVSSSSPGSGTTIHHHDALGRRHQVTHPRTGTTTFAYHDHPAAAGSTTLLVESETDAATNPTTYAFGPQAALGAGRVVAVTRADASVTETSYTARGEINATWGDGVYARLHLYNDYGEMEEMRTYQTLAHGTEPNLQTSGQATKWNYDPATGLLLTKRDANNKGADYAYDPANRITSRKWARTDPGQASRVETNYAYNPRGLLDTVTYSHVSEATPPLEYNYDRLDRVEEVRQGNATIHHYDYDPDTFVLKSETVQYDINLGGTTDLVQRQIRHHSDAHLRHTGYELGVENVPPAPEFTPELAAGYGYDDASRIDRVWHNPASFTAGIPAGTADFQYSYRYETSGNLHIGTSAAIGAGVADSGTIFHTSGPVHTVVNHYESERPALERKENRKNAGNNPWSDYTYSVNPLGQRDSLSLSINPDADGLIGSTTTTAIAWDYNSRDELVEAAHQTTANSRAYKYDDIGNRLETVSGTTTLTGTDDYAANSVNEYTKVEGTNLPTGAYDDDGNLVADGNLNYFWDAENRLVRVTDGGNPVTEFVYDYRSRRIAKLTNFSEWCQFYFYYGWNLIAEYTAEVEYQTDAPYSVIFHDWELEFSFTWGLDLSQSLQGAGGVGGLLVVEKHSSGNAGQYYPTYDGNGNVSEYISATNDGTRVAHYQYDPFGNQTAESTGPLKDLFPHRFSTKYLDEETGFYYYGYRYYDPATGRWPSRDPIEEAGGINLYGFVGNNGANQSDYLGLVGGSGIGGPVIPGWNAPREQSKREDPCKRNRRLISDRMKRVENDSLKRTPDCSDGLSGCILATVIVDLGNPCGGWDETGHAGLAIGDRFYDTYPLGKARWWEVDTLTEFYKPYSTGETYSTAIVAIEFCLCEARALFAESFMTEILKPDLNFIHCSGAVCIAINPASNWRSPFVTPNMLFGISADMINRCGADAGRKANVRIVNDPSRIH